MIIQIISMMAMLTYWLNDNNGINLQYSQDRGNFQVQEDFKSDRIAPRLIYRFSRQTEVFADYSYTGTDFNQKGDAMMRPIRIIL